MTQESRTSLWGFGAAAIYIGFVLFILALVMYASVQDIQLVESGYYEHGLEYQERIDRIRRSRSLAQPLTIEHRFADRQIVLTFPSDSGDPQIDGQVRMIRPSNARLDQRWPVAPDQSSKQIIPTGGMARGQWRLEVEWRMDTAGYYNESGIVIP